MSDAKRDELVKDREEAWSAWYDAIDEKAAADKALRDYDKQSTDPVTHGVSDGGRGVDYFMAESREERRIVEALNFRGCGASDLVSIVWNTKRECYVVFHTTTLSEWSGRDE